MPGYWVGFAGPFPSLLDAIDYGEVAHPDAYAVERVRPTRWWRWRTTRVVFSTL